jgi:hypothetical protein
MSNAQKKEQRAPLQNGLRSVLADIEHRGNLES